MANNETILCDYKGCTKPFAYRIQGFNLCGEHFAEPGEFMNMVMAHETSLPAPPSTEPVGREAKQ